jgi:hypothetical protein
MITLFVMPNFKGNTKDTLQALIVCLLIDACIIVPNFLN